MARLLPHSRAADAGPPSNVEIPHVKGRAFHEAGDKFNSRRPNACPARLEHYANAAASRVDRITVATVTNSIRSTRGFFVYREGARNKIGLTSALPPNERGGWVEADAAESEQYRFVQ
jgi:hypothetical protein